MEVEKGSLTGGIHTLKKLITLRGNSGSGKTTIAKALQKEFGRNTMLISQDMVRIEMLKVKDGEHTLAMPLLKELLIYGNKHSEIVIIEGIMYAEWYRPLFELAKDLYSTQVFAYYFDISFEETLKRHQTRDKCNDFGKTEMQKWWREKDFSDVLEESVITPNMTKEVIIQKIRNDMGE